MVYMMWNNACMVWVLKHLNRVDEHPLWTFFNILLSYYFILSFIETCIILLVAFVCRIILIEFVEKGNYVEHGIK